MTPQVTLFAGLVLPRLLALLTLFAIFADAGQPFNGEEKTAIVDRHNEIRKEPGASDMNYIVSYLSQMILISIFDQGAVRWIFPCGTFIFQGNPDKNCNNFRSIYFWN